MYTFWDKLCIKISYSPQIQRQNVSQLATEVILQTQRELFFSLSLLSLSPLPGLTLTACWSEPWLGIFANSSLLPPSLLCLSPRFLPSSLPFFFFPLQPLPDSHTRLILSLGSYKPCKRGQFSERRGLHSLFAHCALPGKHFQRTHGGGGRGPETVEKENGKDMERLKRRERRATVWAKATLSNCKYRNQLYLVSFLTVVLFSWSSVNLAYYSLQSYSKFYFLEHFFSARAVNENSFRREVVLLKD